MLSRAAPGTPPRSLRRRMSALPTCLCLAVAFLGKIAICPRVLVLTNYATPHEFRGLWAWRFPRYHGGDRPQGRPVGRRLQGLAISLLFGLASSTLLTVPVIPAIYLVLRGKSDGGLRATASVAPKG
jgi:hypothetical protein